MISIHKKQNYKAELIELQVKLTRIIKVFVADFLVRNLIDLFIFQS